jgi:hypothetical protein
MTFPLIEFQKYVRAMPQSEAQTALIFLVNFLVDANAAKPPTVTQVELPLSDITASSMALMDRLGEGE